MNYIVDIIIIAVIAGSTYIGFKKGLIQVGVSFASFIIAIVATMILYNPISNLIINTTNIDQSIQNIVYEKANEALKNKNEDQNENNYANQLEKQAVQGTLPETSKIFSICIIKIIVFILLLIIIKIILMCIKSFSKMIEKLPIIKQFNKTGGIIYGLLLGTFLVYLFLAIIKIAGLTNDNNELNQNIENSFLGKVMYENNVIMLFFDK